ncbi:MAG: type III-A CRISPR-associated RAMP protein Csm4 [Clostridiales bacterium]|nr:type III-A CRISPR-associated RAMP protein Csm4 [Clostridiales bacterium]
MSYLIYKLKFKTAIHIGNSDGGASLGDGEMTIRSDTLIGALCCEAAKNKTIDKLYEYFSAGVITISDTLPYSNDELYLPKPILYMKRRNAGDGSPEIKKALKRIEYIPVNQFNKYMNDIKGGEINPADYEFSFGQISIYTKVNKKDNVEPMPYHIAAWKFKPDCGLYVILKYEEEEAKSLFIKLLRNLGLSGVGGKQTSGLGKFEISEYQMSESLLCFLNDVQAPYQMLLGTALPKDEKLNVIVENGWYKILRRGGFINSNTYSDRQLKKKTIYMLSAGSVLSKRFVGNVLDLSHSGSHPVWRCTNTLFAGVNI